jgi:hypothetical protein
MNELFIDLEDTNLPSYMEMNIQTMFLNALPKDIVTNYIWPRIVLGKSSLANNQTMVHIRRIYRSKKKWVDQSED